MSGWLPAKAKPPELKYNAKQKTYRQQCCKICGKPVYTGTICGSCQQFIKAKKKEEGNHGRL